MKESGLALLATAIIKQAYMKKVGTAWTVQRENIAKILRKMLRN